MGSSILCILIAVELIFLIWDMAKKRKHKEERAAGKVILLLLFGLLCAAGKVKLDFTYYGILVVLSVQAVFSVLLLAKSILKKRKKENAHNRGMDKSQNDIPDRRFSGVMSIMAFTAKSLLYAAVLFPAVLFPQYASVEATGTYQAATALFTYEDEGRKDIYGHEDENRKVNVQFWYPQDGTETYPLVIFSHGLYGIKLSNETLFRELASHGYVVCSIDHPYHAFFTKGDNGIKLVSNVYLSQYKEANESECPELIQKYFKEWMDIRTKDMDFVIETILRKAAAVEKEPVYEKVDGNTIIAAGHSMGGAAALALGRQRKDIRAVISLEAPYAGDITGIRGKRFLWKEEAYPVPVLHIYSDSVRGDEEAFLDSITYEQNVRMEKDSDSVVESVYIKGTRHLGLTDLSLFSPLLVRLIDGKAPEKDPHQVLKEINEISLDFLERYVK